MRVRKEPFFQVHSFYHKISKKVMLDAPGGHSITTWAKIFNTSLYVDISTLNVDKKYAFYGPQATYPPHFVHVVIELPLQSVSWAGIVPK